IENAGALRQALTKRGHVFRSQTDTEVLSHLIEETHTKGTPLVDATAKALRQIEGAYGIAVISSQEPDTIVAARRGSPLLVAIGNGENFVASDASAVLAHTRSMATDRKSTRLNSSHVAISYAGFCVKKKTGW